MKTLHLYLTRQVLATLGMTVIVFTFVLLIGNALKEILVMLVNRQATLGMVLEAFGLLIPWVMAFALPMGMLTAALLVFGRLSADQELTAVRSSGVSLVALISPILLLSLGLCGVCAYVNMEIAPRCRVAYKALLEKTGVKLAIATLPEERYVRDFPGYLVYVGHNDKQGFRDIDIVRLNEDNSIRDHITAERGNLTYREGTNYLHLEGVKGVTFETGQYQQILPTPMVEYPLTNRTSEVGPSKPKLSDMTFPQLQSELKEIDRTFRLPSPKSMDSAALRAQLRAMQQEREDMSMRVQVQMHRQIAFSFACFGFTLVGIPLGIRAHRRETNVGIALALGLVMVYYAFIILGQSLQNHAEMAPQLMMWIPNFLFQSVGAVMLWRANRGI